jgi:hypothetical protein
MGRDISTAQIVVEPETPGDPRTLFRVYMYGRVHGSGLTSAQAHLLVGEILQTMVLQDIGLRGPSIMAR